MTTIDQHTIFAQLSSGPVLDAKAAEVTMDEGWAPFVQVSVTCAVPDPSLLEQIDPRDDVRLTLRLSQDYAEAGRLADLSELWDGLDFGDADGIPGSDTFAALSSYDTRVWNAFGVRPTTERYFNLSLRGRPFSHRDGTVTIAASSDEALLQDYRLLASEPLRPAVDTVRALVAVVLRRIGAALVDGPADAPLAPDAAVWAPGMDAWSYLEPILQQAGLRLWCDGRRVWRLAETITTNKGNVSLSYLGTVIDAQDNITRDSDDWYDAVQITYTFTDAFGTTQTAYDFDATEGWTKALALEYRDTPYPGPGAAQKVLRRALGRGRVLTISAVSDYSVEPSSPVTMTLPGAPIQTGYVSSVRWSLPQGEMEVKSRGLIDTPPSAWVRLPSGQRWIDSPVGASWIDEVV